MTHSLKLEITRRSYSVELPVEDFLALEEAEDILGNGPLSNNTLCDQLGKLLRAAEVEYNGHFGSAIYFSIDADVDTPEMQAKILDMIATQVQKALMIAVRKSSGHSRVTKHRAG